MWRQLFILCCCGLSLLTSAFAQRDLKPWTEWTERDAQKMLNDSPWGRTQRETDTSEMFFRPQAAPDARTGASRADPRRDERGGASNQAVTLDYRIRFLSAKPIRQAIARLMLARSSEKGGALAASLQEFVNRDFGRWIAVSVTVEARDQRYSARARQELQSAVTEVLKNNVYLERDDGRRIFLQTYQPPGSDGLGAKFIFSRVVEGREFLTPDRREVRFHAEVGKEVRLDMRFKLGEMGYEGRLEY